MEAKEVKRGDIIHSNDDTIIKVHHIGNRGEIHYMAFADDARGGVGKHPYSRYYGYIHEAYPATDGEKIWLENWIKNQRLREMAEAYTFKIWRLIFGLCKNLTGFYAMQLPPDNGWIIQFWKFYIWYSK